MKVDSAIGFIRLTQLEGDGRYRVSELLLRPPPRVMAHWLLIPIVWALWSGLLLAARSSRLSARASATLGWWVESDVQLAIELLRLGIKRLGEEYYNENYIDDTGMKLGLAKIKYEEANFKSSADLYKGVLESRLDMFKTLHLK